jgi:4-diphosphocytidyl-2-C-methyl-D-erythritol kinase
VAAGLGGGSSDAAATLRALDRLFDCAVPPAELAALAAGLGSDVPFFLGASTLAIGRGRGDRREPADPLPGLPGVLVMPEAGVATAEAYRMLDRARAGRPAAPPSRLDRPADWSQVAARAHNDFEAVVATARPEVRDALAELRATRPLLALLSGSGSACFALYARDGEAARAAASLAASGRWRTFRIRTLADWPQPAEL